MTAIFRRLGGQHPRIINKWRKIGAAPTYKSSRRVFATSGYAPPTAAVYPEHLVVYHAGRGRTVFIGCMKINAIFLCSFSCFALAPSFYYSPEWPNWTIPAVIIGGAIPMIFVTYTSMPFVSYVRIKLPAFARRSKDQLIQWVQNVPSTTEIDLMTMWFSGRPRVSHMLVSDLRETKARLGIANLARVSSSTANASRPWWMGKEPHIFYVADNGTKSQKPPRSETIALRQLMWHHIMERIRKQ